MSLAPPSPPSAPEALSDGFGADPETCSVVLRFPMKPATAIQRAAVAFVGTPYHVDMVLIRPGTDQRKFYYTMYMGEKFKINMLPEWMAKDSNYTNRRLQVTEEELDAVQDYVHALIDRVEYNYTDPIFLMTAFSHNNSPSSFTNTIITDVDGSDPKCLTQLFCSQAVVIILRECLDEKGSNFQLREKLRTTNSRLCSPCDLFHIVHPYTNALAPERFEALVA